MNSFEYWKKRFDNNDLLDFSRTKEGLLWLKLRSINRKDLLIEFCESVGYRQERKVSVEDIWQDLASESTFGTSLDTFLRTCQERENKKIETSQETIRTNLYMMSHFHWGGDFKNALGRAIYSTYVTTDTIIPFDQLEAICDGDVRDMTRGYLMNSWYNYWSTVLTENLFKKNPGVLPAYGKIKNVDFFVDDFPFDLKVTYAHGEFASLIRKQLGIKNPLTILKKYARQQGIAFSKTAYPEQIRYEIIERMKDSGNQAAKDILAQIKDDWVRTVDCIMTNKKRLIKWLYEHQGDMRFGAENRIFLVLIDMDNPDDSWKLKRNVDLVSPLIDNWVSGFKRKNRGSMLTKFTYKSRQYKAYADVIFAVKESSR